MKKIAVSLFVVMLTAAALFVIGCDNSSSSDSASPISVWELTKDVYPAVKKGTVSYITDTYPLTKSEDLDLDGANESFTTSIYISLENNTFSFYLGYDAITDGGSDTTMLTMYNLLGISNGGNYHCAADDEAFTKDGNVYTYSSDNSTDTFVITGDTMKWTDATDPGTYSEFKKTEITPIENCSAFEVDKSQNVSKIGLGGLGGIETIINSIPASKPTTAVASNSLSARLKKLFKR